MLGVGRIVDKPWVHKGRIKVRKVTQLGFTFDHRVCDGGTAGGFLRFVADARKKLQAFPAKYRYLSRKVTEISKSIDDTIGKTTAEAAA